MEKDKTIPYTAKIVKNGNSLHINVPAFLKNHLEFDKGDLVQVEIKLIKKADGKRPSPEQVTKPINFKGEVQ